MKEETLIQKWLDEELSPTELEAFKQLEEADDYLKLSEKAQHFKAPEFDLSNNYERLQTKLLRTKKDSLVSILLKIAAVFVLGFGAYFTFFSSTKTTVKTLVGTTEKVILPDGSNVLLNAISTLYYDKKNWEDERKVHLQGEAFFKVQKGERFDVLTPAGTITVVGTQFNVKQRGDYFEVTCYEGRVRVTTPSDTVMLDVGENFRSIDLLAHLGTTQKSAPTWINDISSFQSVPFAEVLAEFERQYNVDIRIKNRTFDTNQLFTGSFAQDNMERALQSISVPFNLTYTVNNDLVILKVRE